MPEALVSVDPDLDLAPYAQIAEQIQALIQRDELRPGALLPTVRQLAGDLGVAPNTVARAYAELHEAGWIAGDGRRGTRVASPVPTADRRVHRRTLREAVSRLVSSLVHRGYSSGEIAEELHRALHELA